MQIPILLLAALGAAALWGVIAAVVLVRVRLQAGRERAAGEAARRQAEAELRAGADVIAELEHLAAVRVPAVIRDPNAPRTGMLHPELTGTEVEKACHKVLTDVSEGLWATHVRTDEAAQDIVRSVAGRVRSLAAQMERTVEQAQHTFAHDTQVTDLLYELDHKVVMMRRFAQVAGVVCGDAPGLARTDSYLAELVTAAQARVESYKLIELINHVPEDQPLGVVGPAAEALLVILAELMDNAAYGTVGTMPVKVGIHRTAAGAAVVISDSGPGLDSYEKQEFAQRMLDTGQRLLLTDVGSPPKLGLAAIGRLTRRHAITVTFTPSGARGMECVVHVDASLLTAIDDRPQNAAAPLPAPAPAPVAAVPVQAGGLPYRHGAGTVPAAAPAPAPAATPVAHGGLPPRRRRSRSAAPGPAAAPVLADPEITRDRYARVQESLTRARHASPTDPYSYEEHTR